MRTRNARCATLQIRQLGENTFKNIAPQLQSAKDALTQAEVSKRKAEGERAAAEAAQRRCWPVSLAFQHGALSAQWVNRASQPSHARGTLAADGTVKLALDGYTSKGKAMAGEVTGTVVDNKLTVSGNWSNGTPVNATWLLGQ